MTTGPDDLHVLLGAYVLGGLSDDDHRAYSEHLRTCTQCQAELGQVSGLPRLLDLAGPEGGLHLVAPPPGAPIPLMKEPDDERVSTLLTEVGRRRRRRRTLASVLGAAAAVALFAGGAWLGPSILQATTPEPPTTHVTASAPGSAASVDVALVTRGWGTQLDLECSGLPTDSPLTLWVVDNYGKEYAAASWRAGGSGYTKLTGSTSVPTYEIKSVEVRTSMGKVVASART